MSSKITFEGFVALCTGILGYRTLHKDQLQIVWTTGGQTGGSCWDTGDPVYHPVGGQPEPEFEDLDRLLEALIPDLTFMQYKRLRRELVQVDERYRNDYYGNYTNEATKTVELRQLYNYMLDKGHLNNLMVLIAGLPGSGKTTLAQKIGGVLVDDPLDVKDVAEAFSAAQRGDLVVMADPNFVKTEVRDSCEVQARSFNKDVKILWLFFRNDPDQCISNMGTRQKQGKDHQKVKPATVKTLSKVYNIPDDAPQVPVWNGRDYRW